MNIVALGLDFKGRQLFEPMTEENFAKSLVNAIESNIEYVRDLRKNISNILEKKLRKGQYHST